MSRPAPRLAAQPLADAGAPGLPEGVAVAPTAGRPGEFLERRRAAPRRDNQ